MAHRLKVLIEIQGQIQHCRRLADRIPDPEDAERLRQLMDVFEDLAREAAFEAKQLVPGAARHIPINRQNEDCSSPAR
jgi:hypothetical protein